MRRTHTFSLARASMAALGASAAFAAPAAIAQESDTSALDALVDASANPASAVSTARAQAQQGDLTGAAATLERALLADPNAHDARLFYAGLMCRLDDAQGARVEVAKLAGQNFSDGAWNEAAAACGGVLARPEAPKGSTTGLQGEIAMGVAYDSDALGPLITQIDLPVIGVRRDEGFSWIASARIAGKGKNYASGGDFYGSFNLRSKRSMDGPKQQYDTTEFRAGYGRAAESTDFAVGGVLRHARLFDDPYVTEYGGQAEIGFAKTETSRVVLRAEAVQQDYEKIGPGAFGTGMRYDLSLALEKKLGEDSWLAIGVGAETKDGKVRDFGYNGGRLFASYRRAVGEAGAYFNLATTLRYVDFKDRAPAQDRKDVRGFARAAYGMPVAKDNLILEGALSYTYRGVKDSNTATPPVAVINIGNYHSVGAELRLIWKFGK